VRSSPARRSISWARASAVCACSWAAVSLAAQLVGFAACGRFGGLDGRQAGLQSFHVARQLVGQLGCLVAVGFQLGAGLFQRLALHGQAGVCQVERHGPHVRAQFGQTVGDSLGRRLAQRRGGRGLPGLPFVQRRGNGGVAAAGALADGLKGGLLAAGGQLVSGGKNLLFGHGHDALL